MLGMETDISAFVCSGWSVCTRGCLVGGKKVSPGCECILISEGICVFLVYLCVLASLLARECLCFCLCTRLRMTETEKCLIFLRHGTLPLVPVTDVQRAQRKKLPSCFVEYRNRKGQQSNITMIQA